MRRDHAYVPEAGWSPVLAACCLLCDRAVDSVESVIGQQLYQAGSIEPSAWDDRGVALLNRNGPGITPGAVGPALLTLVL